jgi:hypothetical protein
MTSIASALPASIYSNPADNAGGVSVAKTSNGGLSQTAVTLASDASVIATLGATSGATPIYDATGMLNSLIQAGTSAASSPSNASSDFQNAPPSLDQAIVSSLSSSPTTSGIYTADGSLQTSSSTDLTSNWASILHTNPQLAATAIADSFDQGIVGTLSSSA